MARAAIVVAVVVALLWWAAATQFERFLNRRAEIPLPAVSGEARALHGGAFVADLHADSLLVGRDLTRRAGVGHVDLPRLRAGGVALQVFTVVTRVPVDADIDRTEDRSIDAITLIGCVKGWWRWCTGGPFVRLEDQAERLARTVAEDGQVVWVRSRADLAALRARRARDPEVIGALLGVEGAHAFEADPAKLEAAFALGVRMVGLAHFHDNAYAGSAHGVERGGLTELGRRTLARMEALGILVDVAHLSAAALDDVLARATKPVVVSHGGAKAHCDNARTLSDDQIRAIAAGGGVVGIGYWRDAACGIAPRDVARAIRTVADLVGDAHVALGSDYDGATEVSFDASELPHLTQALLDEGLGEESVRKIIGANVLRVLDATLPEPGAR